MQAIVKSFIKSTATSLPNNRLCLALACSIFLFSCGLSSVNAAKVGLPEGKRYKHEELRQGLKAPYRIHVESPTLSCLYNVLHTDRFAWFCDHFGAGGVTKLKSFLSLEGNEISPRYIDIDLEKAVLWFPFHSEVVSSSNWAGDDFDDVVSALNYANQVFLAVNETREALFAKQTTWMETLEFSREFENCPLATSELKWSLRGALWSPLSDPESGLAAAKKADPDLANYAKQLKQDWSATRTITGRITELPSSNWMTFVSLTGAENTYRAFNFVVDAKRQPVYPRSLEIVSEKSEKGILAELRYVEENGQRIVVNCQVPSVTSSLIDAMTTWDGTDSDANQILAATEASTGEPVIGYSKKNPDTVVLGVKRNPTTKKRALKRILGF
jgi:hypothetical protein